MPILREADEVFQGRQAVEPITPDGRIAAVLDSQANLETAIGLLKELELSDLTTFAANLEKLPEWLAPLEWLAWRRTPNHS